MADTGSLYREIGALKAAASERTEYYARIIREQAKRIAGLEAAHLKAQNSNLLRKQAYESLEKIASEQANRITEQSYGIKKLKENLSDYWQARDEQAKRIAELEASLQRERAMAFSKIQRQRHAIARLSEAKRERGKALVEERISGEFSDWIENQCPHWDIDEEPFCVELDGPCEYHEGKCPISMELHRIAREQLRREGKL